MPLDVSQTGPHRGRLSAQDARRRLEHARSSRAAQLQALRGGGQSADGHLLTAQAEASRRVLKEIEEAFTRLDDGSYGTCLSCSDVVPAERLEILPYTRYCVACQNRLTT
ncbi:TraR/DksA family transcriptional regulator [Streptomyces sp. NPDC056254]|uniref:TraR/DksA family transcriptional regulator n=1 Tax=Streptomyces sp. NPDC056254 TaxID=3345763 RepID=UPI0035D8364D